MHPNYLSIDIGGTNIKSAIIDRSGNILSKKRKKTPQEFTAFLAVLKQIIQDSHEEIRGIAISTPGKVNSDTGTIYFGGALLFF